MLNRRKFTSYLSPSCGLMVIVAFLLFYGFVFRMPIFEEPTYMDSESPGYILFNSQNESSLFQPNLLIELPSSDKTTLIDIKNFEFTMNHDPCNDLQPLLLILIHSSPGNFKKRQILRDTWAKKIPEIIVLFIVGQSEDFEEKLIEENRRNLDIVQGNFIDTYRNLTYKHVMSLKWATYHCQNAKYVLKLDDDVFVHVPALMNFLKDNLSPWGARRLMLCDPATKRTVMRSWRSKWRVSFIEYPEKLYPPYCEGYIILYSLDSVFSLYREAQKESYFWIDDVHITGDLAKKINLTHNSLHSYILNDEKMINLFDDLSTYPKFLFGPKNSNEDQIKKLHYLVINGTLEHRKR